MLTVNKMVVQVIFHSITTMMVICNGMVMQGMF